MRHFASGSFKNKAPRRISKAKFELTGTELQLELESLLDSVRTFLNFLIFLVLQKYKSNYSAIASSVLAPKAKVRLHRCVYIRKSFSKYLSVGHLVDGGWWQYCYRDEIVPRQPERGWGGGRGTTGKEGGT